MTLFQWIVAPLLAAFAAVCLIRVRRGTLPRLVGLAWTAVWLGGVILVLDPGLTTRVGAVFGIGRGADFVFYLAVVGGLYAFLSLYRRMRHLENALTELGREQSLRDALPPRAPETAPGASSETRSEEPGA